MSIKNQSRLPIFALVIIGATVFSLVGLNYLVDKIAKTSPPQMASRRPPPNMKNMNGRDDAVMPSAQPENAPAELNNGMPGLNLKGMPGPGPGPGPGQQGFRKGPDENGGGVMRRMRKGMNGEPGDMRPPAGPAGNGGPQGGNGANGGRMPPRDLKEQPKQAPPPGERQGPSERELIEMEMERRRMEGPPPSYGPPPGYGPPAGYPDRDYEPGPYDGPDDSYYFDEPDYDSKLEDPDGEDIKTSSRSNDVVDEPANDPDFYLEDEYLNEFFDEEEED